MVRRKEKRKTVRIETPESVANCRLLTANSDSGGRFQFTVWPVKNIGLDGMSILSEEEVSHGVLAFLNIDLDIIMRTIGVIAKVMWCKKAERGYEVDLSFSWWPKLEDKELVANFITNKARYDRLKGKEISVIETV